MMSLSPALKITVGVCDWVTSGATASASGVKTKPAR
jgi:hypothetical protein